MSAKSKTAVSTPLILSLPIYEVLLMGKKTSTYLTSCKHCGSHFLVEISRHILESSKHVHIIQRKTSGGCRSD